MQNNISDFDELVINYFQRTLSEKDYQTLLQSMNTDEELKKRFLELKKIRAKSLLSLFESQKDANYKMLTGHLNIRQENSKIHPPPQSYFRILKWVAAVILLCLVSSIASLYIYNKKNTLRQESFISETIVPYGSQVQITLPDSSTVRLNAGSILRYNSAYNKNNREVFINGEGFFEVKKHQDIPFLVNAGEIKTKVLGTVFNVKAYSDDYKIKVGLQEGSINVYLNDEYTNNRILSPNEQLIYNKLDGTIQTNTIEAANISHWTTGKLYFEKSSLLEIFKTLERKYDISIIIESELADNDYFTGSINTDMNIVEMIDFLDVEKKYKWMRNEKAIVVSDK